jgi:hypothetical protein
MYTEVRTSPGSSGVVACQSEKQGKENWQGAPSFSGKYSADLLMPAVGWCGEGRGPPISTYYCTECTGFCDEAMAATLCQTLQQFHGTVQLGGRGPSALLKGLQEVHQAVVLVTCGVSDPKRFVAAVGVAACAAGAAGGPAGSSDLLSNLLPPGGLCSGWPAARRFHNTLITWLDSISCTVSTRESWSSQFA